ncbi:MAG: hypothetical protein ETSY1_11110 [Candidatus Entotheonella factor]|uniref:Glycosidase n=1 Tax=Entotheonella factor TaxID=1429438 RepID=W4LRF7_ENTF1|nr:hypothetical protein [Candidatus Entotheonella palauensis]ETX00465.1 MAG: hypothetical protein ETSY1_11110 [Candidatus Entotheonella factor]
MAASATVNISVKRLGDQPIIVPHMDAVMGANVQGPSLIRVPEWVANPLGRYYLYFADHKGDYIRLAYADALSGPWQTHEPGSLHLHETHFPTTPPPVPEELPGADGLSGRAQTDVEGVPSRTQDATTPHIASPDVHVDHERRQIVMYFHGLEAYAKQVSRVAMSSDGIRFEGRPEILGRSYFRVFHYGGCTYALAMPGIVYRSQDGMTGFEAGPQLFDNDMRHSALRLRGSLLDVFWTRVGEAPERIYVSTIDVSGDWQTWKASEPQEVLRPEMDWEGANLPLEPSVRGAINRPVNQLRDPCLFEEDGRVYLLYAVAGEHGIALAEVFD